MTYLAPMVVKNTTVSTDPNKQPHVLINIEMTFPNMPCFLLEADLSTSVNYKGVDDI
jgi:hypothetical protein